MICYVFHQCNLEEPCFAYALETFVPFPSALPHFPSFANLQFFIVSRFYVRRMKMRCLTQQEDSLFNTNEPIDSNSVVQLKSCNTCLFLLHTGFYFIFYVKSSVTSLFIWIWCPIEATWVSTDIFVQCLDYLQTTFTQATTSVVSVTCFVLRCRS